MGSITPLYNIEIDILERLLREYMTIGGMPAVVNMFMSNGNFSGTLKMQRQLLLDYEEDITKYAQGLDKGKIKNVYDHISVFLGQDNKKFQISKIAHGARNREYVGTIEWLRDAGIINVCYCLAQVSLPLKGNYDPKSYKLYYKDTGLLVASLDEESQEDIRVNKNYGTYKGAIYENIVGDMLVKQGRTILHLVEEDECVTCFYLERRIDEGEVPDNAVYLVTFFEDCLVFLLQYEVDGNHILIVVMGEL